jgi:hypothetical protein
MRISITTLKHCMQQNKVSYRDIEEASQGVITKSMLLGRMNRSKDGFIALRSSEVDVLRRISLLLNIPINALSDYECQTDFELTPEAVQLKKNLYSQYKESFDLKYFIAVQEYLKSQDFMRLIEQVNDICRILSREQYIPNNEEKVDVVLEYIRENCGFDSVRYSLELKLSAQYYNQYFHQLESLADLNYADKTILFYVYAIALSYSVFYKELLVSSLLVNPVRGAKHTQEYCFFIMTLEKMMYAFYHFFMQPNVSISNFEQFKFSGCEDEVIENAILLFIACKTVVTHYNSYTVGSEYLNIRELQALIIKEISVCRKLQIPQIDYPSFSDYLQSPFWLDCQLVRQQIACTQEIKRMMKANDDTSNMMTLLFCAELMKG